jgi:hypothetical protein
MELAKLIVSIIGLVCTFVAAFLAVRTFLRTERWKRAEFVAREMKEYFDEQRVQNALMMIDWASRRVPLFDSPNDQGEVLVTRDMQVQALRPHTLLSNTIESDAEQVADAAESCDVGYGREGAAIRDCYDAFLDGLERFGNYVETKLVDVQDIRPYLEYWVNDIHAPAENKDDAAWSAALLTYIHFYGFVGVQSLFEAFDRSIHPANPTYAAFLNQMRDKDLAMRFAEEVKARGLKGRSRKTR